MAEKSFTEKAFNEFMEKIKKEPSIRRPPVIAVSKEHYDLLKSKSPRKGHT